MKLRQARKIMFKESEDLVVYKETTVLAAMLKMAKINNLPEGCCERSIRRWVYRNVLRMKGVRG